MKPATQFLLIGLVILTVCWALFDLTMPPADTRRYLRLLGQTTILMTIGIVSLILAATLYLFPTSAIAILINGLGKSQPSPRRWQPPPPPLIVRGPPIDAKAIIYDPSNLTWNLKPAILLINLHVFLYRNGQKERIFDEIYLGRTGGQPSKDEIAALLNDRAKIQRVHESNPNYQLAVKRLSRAGVSCEFSGQGDICGEFNVLRVIGSPVSLSLLEAMAAEDAGFTGSSERAQAADRFKIYMLRNYHKDWQENRRIHPNVGGSPYIEAKYWPENT